MDRRTLRWLAATTVIVVALVGLVALLLNGPPDWPAQLGEALAVLGAALGSLRAVWALLPDRDHDGIPDVIDDEED